MRLPTIFAVSGLALSLGLAGCNVNESVSAVTGGLNATPNSSLTALACEDTNVQKVSSVLESLSQFTTKESQLSSFMNSMNSCSVKSKSLVDVATTLIKDDLPRYKQLAQDIKDDKADKVEVARESAQLYANLKYLKDNYQLQQERLSLSEQVKEAILKSATPTGSNSALKSTVAKYDKQVSALQTTVTALGSILKTYETASNSLTATK